MFQFVEDVYKILPRFSFFRASRSLHALADAGVLLRPRPSNQRNVAARDVLPQRRWRLLPKHAARGRRCRARRVPQRHDPHALHAVRLVLRAAQREPAAAPPPTTATGAILLEPVPDVIVQRDSLAARAPKTHLTTQNREGKRTFNND